MNTAQFNQLMNEPRPLTLQEVRDVYDYFDDELDCIGFSCYIETTTFGVCAGVLDFYNDRLIGIFGASPDNFLHESEYGIKWRVWLHMPDATDRKIPFKSYSSDDIKDAISHYRALAEGNCGDVSKFAQVSIYAIETCEREGLL